MSDQFLYVQNQPSTLYGSGAVLGATSVVLTKFTKIDGTHLTMADFGTIGFGTLEPGNGTKEEQICWTGITNNTNGTDTLTGVKTVLTVAPYTQTSGLAQTHAGGSQLVVSNTAGFYDKMTSKNDDETITGTWTFTVPNFPQVDNSATLPTLSAQFATKAYVDGVAIAGAPDASATVKGTTKLSTAPVSPTNPIAVGDNDNRVPTINMSALTAGELLALPGNNTSIAVGTGNKYVTQTGLQNGAETYVASSGSANAYVVAYSPVPPTLAAGQKFSFLANFTNTSASTVAVNGQAAKTIKKQNGTVDLVANDIVSGQLVTIEYDGTNFQMVSPVAVAPLTVAAVYTNGTTTKNAADASAAQNIAHGLGVIPKRVRIKAVIVYNGAAVGTLVSETTYNGTTQSSMSNYISGAFSQVLDTNFRLNITTAAVYISGVVTFDATNIIITWTQNGGASGTYTLLWEANS